MPRDHLTLNPPNAWTLDHVRTLHSDVAIRVLLARPLDLWCLDNDRESVGSDHAPIIVGVPRHRWLHAARHGSEAGGHNSFRATQGALQPLHPGLG